ncbi:proline--tRNA ligase, partial [Candidatus Woesearchaeota archaeon]|nr:proline--tRNA ligase [Candidatus Woesearchaeota archaeon]
IETMMPDGKALQAGTSHNLGQNFSKPFGIKFLDKKGNEQFVWTTSWGVSTRLIGALIMVHGDNKGLVLPPNVAPHKAVVVPIFYKETEKKSVMKNAHAVALELASLGMNSILDDRNEYTPGWKFNEWELKGIPLRMEIGPKDLEADQLVLVRRDTNEKIAIKTKDLEKRAEQTLNDIQDNLFKKAKDYLAKSIVEVRDFNGFLDAIKNKKMPKAMFCGEVECEGLIKDKAEGATCRCIPFEQKPAKGHCIQCGKESKFWAVFGKGY